MLCKKGCCKIVFFALIGKVAVLFCIFSTSCPVTGIFSIVAWADQPFCDQRVGSCLHNLVGVTSAMLKAFFAFLVTTAIPDEAGQSSFFSLCRSAAGLILLSK